METEKVEFEHDAPKELLQDDEPSVNEQLDDAFKKSKKEHKPLKLMKKPKQPRKFEANDYIEIFCVICEKTLTHAKKR